MLQVTYLGTKGTHLFQKGLSLNGIDPVTGLRPYASLTNSTIGWTTYDANSNLDALQVGLKRNLSTGLLVSANYQWSHGISDGSNGDGESDTPENKNCRSCERGATDFDIRHNFTTSAIWIVPVGKGHHLLGSASPLVEFAAGRVATERHRSGAHRLAGECDAEPQCLGSSRRNQRQSASRRRARTISLSRQPDPDSVAQSIRLYHSGKRHVGKCRQKHTAHPRDLASRYVSREALPGDGNVWRSASGRTCSTCLTGRKSANRTRRGLTPPRAPPLARSRALTPHRRSAPALRARCNSCCAFLSEGTCREGVSLLEDIAK